MPGKKEDFAYMAGIVDGEGHIEARISMRRRSDLTLRLRVVNTDKALIDWIQDRWPGRIHVQSDRRHRPCYCWNIGIRKGRSLLEELLPYLVVKKREVEMVLQLADLTSSEFRGRGRSIPKENMERRLALVSEIREGRRVVAS